jgi:hypothetical protein
MYVQRDILVCSLDVYISSAIQTVRYDFTQRKNFYDDLMSLDTIKRTQVFM